MMLTLGNLWAAYKGPEEFLLQATGSAGARAGARGDGGTGCVGARDLGAPPGAGSGGRGRRWGKEPTWPRAFARGRLACWRSPELATPRRVKPGQRAACAGVPAILPPKTTISFPGHPFVLRQPARPRALQAPHLDAGGWPPKRGAAPSPDVAGAPALLLAKRPNYHATPPPTQSAGDARQPLHRGCIQGRARHFRVVAVQRATLPR